MSAGPPPLVAPENHYNEATTRDAAWEPSVAVVIPVYNRVDRLDATLAGLVTQTRRPDEVVVADDGSQEDVGAVVDRYRDRMSIRLVRQERDGFGAGRARNLGADGTDSDIVIFIDSDCIPVPEFVDRHLWWHRRAAGLVVVGSRYHIDGDAVSPAMVESDFPAVRAAAVRIPEDGAPDDWRGLFYRRNRKLTIGDGAYRAVLSSNVSVDAQQFSRVGGFLDAFKAWGGEDTELGWRLWNDGAFVVAANDAAVFHQLEQGEDRTWRMDSIERNRPLMADRVPHRFYRKVPSVFHLVPRVSWVVAVASAEEVDAVWTDVSRSTYPDTEVVLTGPSPALERVAAVVDNPRVVSVPGPDIGRAIEVARGEFVAILDGRLRPNRRMLEHAVRRFEGDPRIGAVRGAYAMKGVGTFRRFRDLEAIDATDGRGAPLFAVVRRREVMKDIRAGELDWPALFRRCRLDLLVNDTVEGDASDFDLPSRSRLPLGTAEVMRAGTEESARAVVRAFRARRAGARRAAEPSVALSSARPVVRYVGWTGHQNLGDEAMLAAVRTLMPWAEIDPSAEDPDLLMLGGGTLFNANGGYLSHVERLDSPYIDRVVFGTGVRSPSYWGVTEPVERWWDILDSSLAVTVRGPDSERHLRRFGYEGQVDVIGDPALALERPDNVERVAGRVVVCHVYTGGRCWGGDDLAVFDRLAQTIARLTAEGREVVIMTAYPGDDRWAMSIMRDAGHPHLSYVPGYADLDATLELLSSSDLVIGERLHGAVLAAAVGTPFVAVEYRPKLRDFARSIGREDDVVRTDEMERLDEVVDAVIADRDRIAEEIGAAVDDLRGRQRTVAQNLRVLTSK